MSEAFVNGLFSGVVAENLVFPYPEPSRGEADQVLSLSDVLRKLAPKFDSARFDREGAISEGAWKGLRGAGMFGLSVPKEYGGAGLGVSAYARVIQELAAFDLSVALTVSAHASLGITALRLFGSPELEREWLPRLASGDAIAAFALSEEGAGSDAAAIQTRADWDGDAFVLRGEKTWVTNGETAQVFIVFARTSPADDGAKPRLTAFFVERSAQVRSGTNAPKLGVRGASTTTVTFDNVRVPKSHVLGEPGRGFKVAMKVLTHARLSLASACIGVSKRLLRMSVERIGQRKTFGRTIAEFGLIRDKVAQMTSDLFALESATYLTTGMVDQGQHEFAVESAICKVMGSETLWRIANEASQIAGAVGYSGAEPWERLLRDARVPMVFEGTNEILRCFIALSGMQGPSRDLEDVTRSMREPIKGFGLLSDFALRKARSALSRERLPSSHPLLVAEAELLEQYTGYLAKSVEKVLRRHGKNIAEMQYAQRRVADMAMDLYAVTAVLSRTTRSIERRGEEGARREIDLASVFALSAKKRLTGHVAAFDDNDDELRKAVAQKTCADGGYPLDIV